MDSGELQDALAREIEEQQRLVSLRGDYHRITQSRFYGFTLVWAGLKHLFGKRTIVELPPGGATLATPSTIRRTPDETKLHSKWSTAAATWPLSQTPLVTIVIPAFNHFDVTAQCLQSIASTWFDGLAVQVVLVDDGSNDQTSEFARLDGLDYIRNGRNSGFIHSCNRGASIARGKYLCFLNNDTIVRPGWLDHLVALPEGDATIGAVGAKLLYPDGRLQEAGGIIFRDGNGWNYGRGDDPDDARYNYLRDVDYCSGAALLVRADLFTRLGGFDARFAPAYYEDADLCFAIRALGYRVVYQPRSNVVHNEGSSSGVQRSSGTKRYQDINRPIFAQKWAAELSSHSGSGIEFVPTAARRIKQGQTILVVDSYVPLFDKEAGSNRLYAILKLMVAGGYRVIFMPDNYAAILPYVTSLEQLGIEVLYHTDRGRSQSKALDEVVPLLDVAWICRPELFEKYAPLIRRNPDVKLIYDTIDLHFLRTKRAYELFGEGDESDWKRYERMEISAARSADAVITVTDVERDVLRGYDVDNIHVVPTLHELQDGLRAFGETSGILFIGGYNHAPNRDAVQWLCRDIMPIVWRTIPKAKVTLLGSNPSDDVRALQSDRIRVPGYLPDVTPYFQSHRLFVAPIRFGAGLNGKIGHSLAFGLPVVTTPLGAEGFNLESHRDCLIASDAQAFADAMIDLYTNENTWNAIHREARRAIIPFGSNAIAPRIGEVLESMMATVEA